VSAAAVFAFGAGLVATINPCGFAMLPSFLSLYVGSTDGAGESLLARTGQGFRVGLALTAGFVTVFVVAGLILSIGLRSFVHVVPWLAMVIAAALIVLGVAMVLGARIGLTAASRVAIDERGAEGYGRVLLFGATYALASLSCTLAVFLVVVSQAVAAANPVTVLAVFASYAAGAATVLVALSLSAALAKAALARAVRRLAPAVNRIAGALLAASGVYLVLYWLPALKSGPSSTPSVVRFTESLSSTLQAFFSAHTALFVVALAALTAAGALLLPATSGRGWTEPEPEPAEDCCEPEPELGRQPAHARELVVETRR